MPYLGVRPADITSAAEAEIAGDLTVDTNTLHVDAANDAVGIGTASPNANRNLHLLGSTSGGLRIEGTARGGYVEITDGTNTQYLGTPHSIAGSGNATDLSFWTAGSERGRFLAGGGLTFNGDTAAANALSDFETGSWTPTSGIGSAPTNSGHYTKIGRLVTVYGDCTFTGSGTASAAISGLPFTIAPPQTGGAVGFNNISSGVMLIASTGGSLVLYSGFNAAVDIPNNGRIIFCITYQVS